MTRHFIKLHIVRIVNDKVVFIRSNQATLARFLCCLR